MGSDAKTYARTLSATLDEVWAAIDSGEEIEGQDAREYLEEMPLSIERRIGAPFTVLLTYGGPTAWLECHLDDGGDVQPGTEALVSSWGGDRERLEYGEGIRRTVAYFAEMTEG